jgi:excisionase family DNA binding protein
MSAAIESGPVVTAGDPLVFERCERLMTIEQVAGLMKVHQTTVWRMVKQGTFPPPVKLGSIRRWRATEYNRWLDELGRAKESRGRGPRK